MKASADGMALGVTGSTKAYHAMWQLIASQKTAARFRMLLVVSVESCSNSSLFGMLRRSYQIPAVRKAVVV